MRRTSPALSTAPRLELTLRGDRATSLRRRGLPVPSGASENGALAQLGERRNGIAEVAGSIPACSTNVNTSSHGGIGHRTLRVSRRAGALLLRRCYTPAAP